MSRTLTSRELNTIRNASKNFWINWAAEKSRVKYGKRIPWVFQITKSNQNRDAGLYWSHKGRFVKFKGEIIRAREDYDSSRNKNWGSGSQIVRDWATIKACLECTESQHELDKEQS